MNLCTIVEYIAASDKGCVPEELGPGKKVPIEEGIVKDEHLIPSCGGLHLWHCQAVLIGCKQGVKKIATVYSCGLVETPYYLY